MEIVKPWVKIEGFDGKKIMKNLERACRTCYRSEGLITEDSYKNLLKNCLTKGHESILEHEKITVRIPDFPTNSPIFKRTNYTCFFCLCKVIRPMYTRF